MANWVDTWADYIMAEEARQQQAEREFVTYWAMSFFEERDDDGIRRADFLERLDEFYGQGFAMLVDAEITRISADMREYLRYEFPSPAKYERMARDAEAW